METSLTTELGVLVIVISLMTCSIGKLNEIKIFLVVPNHNKQVCKIHETYTLGIHGLSEYLTKEKEKKLFEVARPLRHRITLHRPGSCHNEMKVAATAGWKVARAALFVMSYRARSLHPSP